MKRIEKTAAWTRGGARRPTTCRRWHARRPCQAGARSCALPKMTARRRLSSKSHLWSFARIRVAGSGAWRAAKKAYTVRWHSFRHALSCAAGRSPAAGRDRRNPSGVARCCRSWLSAWARVRTKLRLYQSFHAKRECSRGGSRRAPCSRSTSARKRPLGAQAPSKCTTRILAARAYHSILVKDAACPKDSWNAHRSSAAAHSPGPLATRRRDWLAEATSQAGGVSSWPTYPSVGTANVL